MNEIAVTFPDGTSVRCPFGTRAESLVDRFSPSAEPAAVKVNNEILSLSTRLEVNSLLEPVPLNSHEGSAIYRRTLSFILAVAARDLFPDRSLYVGHSLGRSFYYSFADERKPTAEEIEALSERMGALTAENLPIRSRHISYADAWSSSPRTGKTTRRSFWNSAARRWCR